MPISSNFRRVSSCIRNTYKKLTEQLFIISFKQGYKQNSSIIARSELIHDKSKSFCYFQIMQSFIAFLLFRVTGKKYFWCHGNFQDKDMEAKY